MRAVTIAVSYGEAADRLAILSIKNERIRDPAKLAHVRRELALLNDAFFAQVPPASGFDALLAELKGVNETLWEIEDALRVREAAGDFGEGFVQLAREVYRTNDARARLKRAIDELLGSDLREEKSYGE
ncbi:MAG: hypothetical protein JO261_11045 [Alphaproteobacteria bacterium]|nr:hypothetical protein [Alphaproteobacteria bacterium]MBV9694223.1 hypothetical protein [Alphaproteobacteria bacterium]